MAKKKTKNYVYTTKHKFKKGDLVEFTWLGTLKLGTILELRTTNIDNKSVAIYSIKDMHSDTKYPSIGHNDDLDIGNIVKKLND